MTTIRISPATSPSGSSRTTARRAAISRSSMSTTKSARPAPPSTRSPPSSANTWDRSPYASFSLSARGERDLSRESDPGAPNPRCMAGSREPAPSEEGDVFGLKSFLAVDHLDPDPLARIEGVDAAAAQRGDVNEHVLAAAVGRNEAVALIGLEPLHRAFHGLGGPGATAVEAAACALRHHRGAVVDVQDGCHQRAFCPGADLADDRSAFMDVLIAGATQDRHRQERVLGSVGRGDEPETLAGVEPLDFGFDAATGGKVFAKKAGAAVVHRSSKR